MDQNPRVGDAAAHAVVENAGDKMCIVVDIPVVDDDNVGAVAAVAAVEVDADRHADDEAEVPGAETYEVP
jgi:hypothetical protein